MFLLVHMVEEKEEEHQGSEGDSGDVGFLLHEVLSQDDNYPKVIDRHVLLLRLKSTHVKWVAPALADGRELRCRTLRA
ncbi:uncharacterized protein METZ01_LOCUS456619 [marine metagenome]|uniref:Uncharacterized protein n=1 Tax=marine metagenome TaxID=408172 RepID=A0A383A986_9ZZZZ